MPDPVTGIVLAAGAGTRYGMPKVHAEGGSWVRGAVAALHGGGCTRVLVVVGSTGPAAVSDAEVVFADRAAHGLSRSVSAGLASAAGERSAGGVVLTLVDLPDVGARCVARVIGAGRAGASGVSRAVYGGAPGHPVYLSGRRAAQMRSAIASACGVDADSGLRRLLPEDTELVECGDLATGADIDFAAEVVP